ncbi:Hydrogenase transcriptional regulatory protein hupR1 [compost metagenome]
MGGSELRRSNFRLISASNRNFEAMIADGTFRLDLFYRIGGVTIRLPALRERLEDIPLLVELALKQFADRHGQRAKKLSDDAIAFLQGQRWPGNVRQLIHTVERAAIFSDSDVIEPADFGTLELEQAEALSPASGSADSAPVPLGTAPQEHTRVSSAVEQVEEQMIRQAMAKFNGNKKRVAIELGISRSYLYKRLAQMGFGASESES